MSHFSSPRLDDDDDDEYYDDDDDVDYDDDEYGEDEYREDEYGEDDDYYDQKDRGGGGRGGGDHQRRDHRGGGDTGGGEYDDRRDYDDRRARSEPDAGGVHRAHGRPAGHQLETFKVSHRRHRFLPWLIGVVVALVLVAAVATVTIRHDIDPGHPGAVVTVVIPHGASTTQIATILAKAGVIDDASVFRLYTKVEGIGVLLPGTYHLHRNSSYGVAISALEAGPPIVYQKFTIPEGFTLAQIADRVGSLPGRSASAFMAAANSDQVQSQYQPAGQKSLEGLLFPATYTIRADQSDLSIVQTMVQAFDDKVADLNLPQVAATLGITPYQVVIVASMVEREAKLDVDRGPIASVIYNRLKAKMLLQIDATLLYGQGITDPKQMDKNSDSPYNTYRFRGLPPTPIASPGLPSLMAAANPPKTDYFYYVVINSTGKSGFATTAQQFQGLLAQARANGVL